MKNNKQIQPYLQMLPPELHPYVQVVHFEKNQIVVRKGEPTVAAYLLTEGELNVQTEFENGSYYSFANIIPGRFASDLEVLAGRSVNAVTLVAKTDSTALKIPLDQFVRCIEENHAFLRFIARGICNAMYETSYEQGQNLYKNSSEKLIHYILRYGESHNATGRSFRITVIRQNIAAELGVTVKTVNRAVNALHERELLNLEHGKMVISPDQYQKMKELVKQ